ncbi:MAG TPA: hypothetical protein VFZ89_16165 [Solirubrobacteraceae bacterium]
MIRRLSLFVVALCALAISACGSSDALEGKDAAGVLKETFGPDHPVRSGRLALNLRFDATGLGIKGPINARLSGPFQSNGGKTLPSVDLSLALTAGEDSLSAGIVSTGEKGYLKLADQVYDAGDDLYKSLNDSYRAASTQTDKESESRSPLASLGIEPLRWLKAPKTAGEEDIGGTKTVHVTADVDVAKLLQDVDTLLAKAPDLNVPGAEQVPTRLSAKQRATIAEAVKKAGFDVWSGKADGALRRMRAEVSFDVPESARKGVGGLRSGTIVIDLTLSQLNEEQEIKAPAGARPLSELTGTTASGGGGTAPPAAPSASGGDSQYLQCLESAGSDLKKVQQCASLLGQ